MPNTPITKQLISLIFLLFIYLSVPLGAAAQITVPPEQTSVSIGIKPLVGGLPVKFLKLIWSLSPDDGTATLGHATSITDSEGFGRNTLTFSTSACGTYTVTVQGWKFNNLGEKVIIYNGGGEVLKLCSTSSPSGTTSSSSSGGTSSLSGGTSSPPPPPSPQLVKISADNQVTRPEDSVILSVEFQDLDGSPMSDVELIFFILSGDGASLNPTKVTTDANGRAQTTLTFETDATGEYIIDVHRSDNPDVYTEFTVTVDPLLPKATRLEKFSGDNQTGLTGGVWAAPFVVEVRDQYDAPLEGTTVTFTVLTGGGRLSAGTTTTDANGWAASTLRLGAAPGINTVEVSAEGISETVTFTAETISLTLRSVSGNNQIATVGTALANPFVVEVHDGTGNPLAGVTVTFVVRTGGGTLSNPTSITDASGQADSTLHLGTASGPNTVEVSVEGTAETVTFTAEAISPTLRSVSGNNQIAAVGTPLANPFVVEVHDGTGNPLAGVTVTFVVRTGGGTLSTGTATTDTNGLAASTLRLGTASGPNTVEVNAEDISEIVTFSAVAELLEFDLSLSAGFNLIHLPLKVRVVDGMPTTLQSVSDLYDALGGADTVNWLLTQSPPTQVWDPYFGAWDTYFGDADRGTTVDKELTDQIGILANMLAPVSIRLGGEALGTDGNSTITLNEGLSLVGLPLRDSRVTRVSDLFSLDGIGGNVPIIIVTDNGEVKTVNRAGDPGDIAITGGQSFILTAQQAATVGISGEGWSNPLGTTAASPMAIRGIQAGDTTPVLALKGSIVDGGMGLKVEGFRVTVKNLSTGSAVVAMTLSDEIGYRSTIVAIETGRAARVGDILEISAESPNPFMGVKPLRYTVTVEDIKRHRIELPSLVTYEIPAETALLPNYPNPFNPETWIPYRLSEDADVSLIIYDMTGQVVRTIDVGHQIASTYENRSKAIYWDGRNRFGEGVASGVYFYSLSAGDFSATRKMVILK